MATNEKYVRVKNLTDNPVVYLIPEDNLRRVYGPYEEKNIKEDELQKLFYQPGGAMLLQEFLQVQDKDLAEEFGVDAEVFEHEYSWDKDKVDSVLLKENIDVLHDALDFAPEGIIDLIVERAVALDIADINKRELIKKYTGRDVNQMIATKQQLNAAVGTQEKEAPKRRRVTENKSAADNASLFTGRRAE